RNARAAREEEMLAHERRPALREEEPDERAAAARRVVHLARREGPHGRARESSPEDLAASTTRISQRGSESLDRGPTHARERVLGAEDRGAVGLGERRRV